MYRRFAVRMGGWKTPLRDRTGWLSRTAAETVDKASRATPAQIEAVLNLDDEGETHELDAEAVERVTDKLPFHMRQLLRTALLGNESYAEIAGRLGMSQRAVEMNIQNALGHCARHLQAAPKALEAPEAAERSERPGRASIMLAALALVLFCPGTDVAVAQFSLAAPPPRTETARPLALPPTGGPGGRILNSTGFFVDGIGHVLTARHAVESCTQIVVSKERYRIAARLVALSSRQDLALVKIPKTLGLAAVFPRTATPADNEMMFASAYRLLGDSSASRNMLANARVVSSSGSGDAGQLLMESLASFGTSGAPVLDKNGLVQGVVSRRTVTNRVAAAGAVEAKAFLSSQGIRFEQDDRPQLAGSASRASRAASISAQVICVQE